MKNTRFVAALAVAGAGLYLSASAYAVVVPFTEAFPVNASNWRDGSNLPTLVQSSTGGPANGSYVTTAFNFAGTGVGDQVLFFRGEGANNASSGAFVGNYITGGVTAIQFDIRQNSGQTIVSPANPGFTSVGLYLRLAPAGGPGLVAFSTVDIPSDVWTTVTIPVSPAFPYVYEGTNFNVFNSISKVQVGMSISPGFTQARVVTFDLTNVTLLPAPGAGAMVAVAGLIAARRKR